MNCPTIETARMILRPHRLSDKEAHVAMWADPRVTAFIGGEPRPEQLSWSKFLAGAGLWPVMGYGYWVFADKASDRLIGQGGLSYFARGIAQLEGVPEAGWAFDADHWGQGLATEAMAAALAWADAHLHAAEIRCIIDEANVASVRVGQKLGFAKCAEALAEGDPVAVFARPRATSR